jgi:hypothetical protein
MTGVAACAFHPGIAASDIYRDSEIIRFLAASRLGKALQSTPEQGAEPLLHLATTPDPSTVDGGYFERLDPKKNSAARRHPIPTWQGDCGNARPS